MKKFFLLLLIYVVSTFNCFSQLHNSDPKVGTIINVDDKINYEYKLSPNDRINGVIKITKHKNHKRLLWQGISSLGLMSFNQLETKRGELPSNQSIGSKSASYNIGILSTLSALNIFSKKGPEPIVEAIQYDLKGKMLSTERLHFSKGKRSTKYTLEKNIVENGTLVLSIQNISKAPIQAFNISTVQYSNNESVDTDSIIEAQTDNALRNPLPDPAYTLFYPDALISGYGGGFSLNFLGSYYVGYPPTANWAFAVGNSGGGSSGGGGSGSGGSGPPSPGEKKMLDWLNRFGANKCEGQYIADHAVSDPLMGAKLLANKLAVEQYMDNNGMAAANQNGSAVENAYKHALFSAYNLCSIGETHAEIMANNHEICGGVNQNPNNQEWYMDDYNNHQGFDIARGVGCDPNNIKAAVSAAYHNGILIDVNGNPTYE